MKKYDAIFFDLDDTLYDGSKAWLYSVNRLIELLSEKYGSVDFSDLNDILGKVRSAGKELAPNSYSFAVRSLMLRNALDLYEVDYSWKELIEIESAYTGFYLDGIEPIDGVEELMKELVADYDMYVLTDFTFTEQLKRIDRLGLGDIFEDVITAQEVGDLKKSGKLHKVAVDRYKLDPKKVLMVGDTAHSDIVPANVMGMTTVLVPNAFYPPSEDDKAAADYFLGSVVDLREVL